MQNRWLGKFLILVGVAAFFLSILFVKGYEPHYGLLMNIQQMELVLRENEVIEPHWKPSQDGLLARSLIEEELGRKETDVERKKREVESRKRWEDEWEAYREGERNRIAIPYKFFLSLDLIIIFVGIGLLIVPEKQIG